MLQRIVDVKDDEVGALLWSFFYFFTLLSGTSLMRPIRDEMGVAGGTRNLPWAFTATFVVMLALVPLFAWLVARVPRFKLVPLVYQFFVLNLLGFFVLWRTGVEPVWTGRVFYIWHGVYNLFVVSLMWSVMADTWRTTQGQRLFGFVFAGGSAGAVLGPTLTTALVGIIGPANLILFAAGFLEISALCVVQLGRFAARTGGSDAVTREPIGGGIFAAIKNTLASPYLLTLAASVLLYTITSTFLYLEQARLLEALVPDRQTRTQIFGAQDMAVNIALIFVQAGLTGRILTRLGVGVAVTALPIFTLGGFALLFIVPKLAVLAVVQAARRVVHFTFDRPSREVLFTVVSREDKYKAKSFIDTVVYRGGDTLGAWMFTALGTLATPAAIALAISWIGVTVSLGRRYAARKGAPS